MTTYFQFLVEIFVFTLEWQQWQSRHKIKSSTDATFLHVLLIHHLFPVHLNTKLWFLSGKDKQALINQVPQAKYCRYLCTYENMNIEDLLD